MKRRVAAQEVRKMRKRTSGGRVATNAFTFSAADLNIVTRAPRPTGRRQRRRAIRHIDGYRIDEVEDEEKDVERRRVRGDGGIPVEALITVGPEERMELAENVSRERSEE